MKFFRSALLLVLSLLMASCQLLPGAVPEKMEEEAGTETTLEAGTTKITFFAEIPAELAPGQELMIEFLDEITGLAIVPARFPMEQIDVTHFELTREFADQAIIKYRYFRKGDNPSIENNSLNRQVRYRFIFSSAAPLVYDQIAGWNDILDVSPTGIIEGKIRDSHTSEPAAGILVACGGDQVVSGADGSYRLDKLKGRHTHPLGYEHGRQVFPFPTGSSCGVQFYDTGGFHIKPGPLLRSEIHLRYQ
ncbi:MAG: hypothetical protein AB9891_18790 [Anaerolineaceae bacterium]